MTEIQVAGARFNVMRGYVGEPASPSHEWAILKQGYDKYTLVVDNKRRLADATMLECLIEVAHLDEIQTK